MSFAIERRDPGDDDLRLALDALQPWLADVGPVAVVDLETTGLPDSRSAEIIEIGVVLLDPGEDRIGIGSALVRPGRPIPALVSRLTGLVDADLESAPRMIQIRDAVRSALAGRTIVAHQADFERSFLRRDVDSSLGTAPYLDTQDILALTHPDASDMRLETFTRLLLDREERHRAFHDALDAAAVLGTIAKGAQGGDPRYVEARRIVDRHLPSSPWRGLFDAPIAVASADLFVGDTGRDSDLASEVGGDFIGEGEGEDFDFADFAESANGGARDSARSRGLADTRYLEIGSSDELPVAFELDAILEALGDVKRGQRHFPGYRVREEQLDLAREFYHVFEDGGIAKLEGGTGVGKSLAYLAAAIPFAIAQANEGCLLYTSPSPRDLSTSRMPSSA